MVLLLSACEREQFAPEPEPVPTSNASLSHYLAEEGSSTLFADALIRTGLDLDSLSGQRGLAFVPTNAAFADSGFDPATLSLPDLTALISYHLTDRDMAYRKGAGDFVDVLSTRNTTGPDRTHLSVVLRRNNGTFSANGARARGIGDVREQPAGQVIFLDRVLLPPTLHTILTDLPDLSRFRALAGEISSVSDRIIGDFATTLFSPVDTAVAVRQDFIDELTAAEREQLLLTHMLGENVVWSELLFHPGNTLSAGNVLDLRPTDYGIQIRYLLDPRGNGVRIIEGGIQTQNGVLYLVDRVLVPE